MPPRRGRTRAHVRVRRARPSDLEAIAALEAAAFQPFRRASRASLRRSLASARQSVWVVDAPAGGLAALLVLWHHPRLVRVYDVATRPDLQGQGLGSRLMEHAEELARKAGARIVSLEADPREAGLVEWYLHRGYSIVARLPGYYAPGRAAVRMRKALDGA
jgi:[ribosomal protein S18]-alanine N-acetyltransferase